MAQLLGQADQLESLQQDLGDLQSVITDAISHVGRIRCTSWRSPDKLACDLDVTKLLESYRYSVGNNPANQLAHVVLIETIIDRLVLMLQLMNKFMDRIKMDEGTFSASQGRSVGIVAKRYWLRLVRIVTHLQQHPNNPAQTNLPRVSILEEPLSKSNLSEIIKNKFCSTVPNNNLIISTRSGHASEANTQQNISREGSNKAIQTTETLFVPCDACSQTQNGFKNVAALISDVHTKLNLEKAAEKNFKVRDAWMTASEIHALIKDVISNLNQIKDETIQISTSVEPLKSQLLLSEEKCKELTKREEKFEKENKKSENEFKKEKERMKKELDASKKLVQQIEDKFKETESKLNQKLESATVEIKNLKLESEKMLTKYDKLFERMEEKEKALNTLESDKKKFNLVDEERKQLLERVKELELNKEETLTNLNKVMKLLNMEQERVKKDEEYNQEVMEKHNQMLEDLEKLDTENDSLRKKIDNLTDSKNEMHIEMEKFEKTVSKLRDEIEQKEQKLQEFEKLSGQMNTHTSPITPTESIDPNDFLYIHNLPKKYNLYKNLIQQKLDDIQVGSKIDSNHSALIAALRIQLQELKDQKTLLVNYPELNPRPASTITGGDDVAVEMEYQIEANKIRINVLQDENHRLTKSVQRIKNSQLTENTNNNDKLDEYNFAFECARKTKCSSPMDKNRPSSSNQIVHQNANNFEKPIHEKSGRLDRSSRKHLEQVIRNPRQLEHSISEQDLFQYIDQIGRDKSEISYSNLRNQTAENTNNLEPIQVTSGPNMYQVSRRNSGNSNTSPSHFYPPHPPRRTQGNIDLAFNPVDLSFVIGRRPDSGGSVKNRREVRKISSAKK